MNQPLSLQDTLRAAQAEATRFHGTGPVPAWRPEPAWRRVRPGVLLLLALLAGLAGLAMALRDEPAGPVAAPAGRVVSPAVPIVSVTPPARAAAPAGVAAAPTLAAPAAWQVAASADAANRVEAADGTDVADTLPLHNIPAPAEGVGSASDVPDPAGTDSGEAGGGPAE